MSVFKRGSIWHYEFQYRGTRYRGSTGETTKAQAREAESRERLKAKLGRSTKDITLREAALSWWDLHAQFLKSAHVIDEGLKTCDRILKMDTRISQLTTHDLVEGVARRRGETTFYGRAPSNATINREIPYNIRPILNHATYVLGVTDAPTIAWKKVVLTKPKPRPRDFTEKERRDIVGKLPAHLHDLHAFYSKYGTRWMEAFFPLDRFDTEAGRIALRERKGGDWHTIPLTDADRRSLAAKTTRARAADLNTVWFKEDRYGRLVAIKPREFQRAMLKAIKELGIKDARAVHDLRHDAAMQAMRRSKGRIAPVSKLLGHESIQTTQIYAHASEDDVRDILEDSPQNPHNADTSDMKKSTGTKE